MQIEYEKVKWKPTGPLTKFRVLPMEVPVAKIGNGPRVLVILDAVNREDVAGGRLIDNDSSGVVFNNLLKFVQENCGLSIGEVKVVNFDSMYTRQILNKNSHLENDIKAQYKKRMLGIIKRYKPERILIMGKEPANVLAPVPQFKNNPEKQSSNINGRVRFLKFNGKKIPTVTTHSLSTVSNDFRDSYGDMKVFPNLLGEVGHHFQNCIYGKNRYTIDLEEFKVHKVYTLAAFKAFFKKLKACRTPSYDTEGENLTRISNRLLTMQFSLDAKTGYFIPIYHPETPFTSKELAYIKKKMKWWFERGKTHCLVGAHLKYDVMQAMRAFDLRWINHDLYDIAGAENGLDENRKFRRDIGLDGYGLEQLTMEYGSFTYSEDDGSMKKSERENMREVPLERIARYGVKDVVVPAQIRLFQLREAKRRGSDYAGYEKQVIHVLSDMTLHFANMEMNGLLVDRDYLIHAMGPNSEFVKLLAKTKAKLYSLPSVKRANAIILKKRGAPTRTLFDNTNDSWVFDIGNVESQQTLFFKVLKLDPDEQRKDGGGKIGKAFQLKFKDVPEVALFKEFQLVTKLKNTFINGFFKKLAAEPDMKDGRLRPNFMYLSIITGRAGASKPSLQQLPSRSSLSKPVKRQFIPGLGNIFVKADFSAHEVRMWGLIAGDALISASFRIGLRERQQYRLLKIIDDALQTEWAMRLKISDIHRVNYQFFYGKQAKDVTAEERQSIKQVVFGVIYGKGANSLADELGIRKEEAKKLINLLFEKFEIGGDWIKQCHEKGHLDYRVVGPFGNVRHLWGYMHHSREVHGMMDRRGPNSVIQGSASFCVFIGSRELSRVGWDFFESQGQPLSLKPLNSVHDSTEGEASIMELPLSCYLHEHAYTTLLHRRCAEKFGFKMKVGLEMAMEIGPSLGNLSEYNFRKDNLLEITSKSIDFMREELHYDLNKKKLMRIVNHNATILDDLRKSEIRVERKIDEATTDTMQMNKKNALKMGLIFAQKAA